MRDGAVQLPALGSPYVPGDDQRIERVMMRYRDELLAGMNRYHGCDRYKNERSCRADVYRVDHVILPVVRKMLEDLSDIELPEGDSQ